MVFLPNNLRYLRKKIGQSQSFISKLVEKKQNTIGNWENAVSEPTLSELAKLAQYFGVSIQDLLTKDLQAEPPVAHPKKEESVIPKLAFNKYPETEAFPSVAQESGQHQFWVIIGELRRIHEKLDSIKNQLDGKFPEKHSLPRSGL
jgi:transcriptional regulator with XRE-family HTH domain